MERDKLVGLAVGIVQQGRVSFAKGYGTREMHKNLPVDSLTNFLTASISKLFTATGILQLCEAGEIRLSDKLIDYVPEFTMKDTRYREITIYQMLTHTAGLPNFFSPNFIRPTPDSLALSKFAEKLATKKLPYPPGVALSKETYSNTGYNLLGLVIERVTSQTFSDYMDENVLGPVGMKNSSFFYTRIPENLRSTPHKKNRLTGKISPSRYYPDIPQDKPCGNLNSCIADLCRWMIHNLQIYRGQTPAGAVLERKTLEKMWTTQEQISGFKTSIGLGWWIVESEIYGKYLFHVGNDPGFSATLMISPANDFGIVLLCNGRYPMEQVWNEIPFEIIDLLAGNWKK